MYYQHIVIIAEVYCALEILEIVNNVYGISKMSHGKCNIVE